jgi:hypothetical protein
MVWRALLVHWNCVYRHSTPVRLSGVQIILPRVPRLVPVLFLDQ